LIAPPALRALTAYEITGVGVGPSVNETRMPLAAKTSAQAAAKFSE